MYSIVIGNSVAIATSDDVIVDKGVDISTTNKKHDYIRCIVCVKLVTYQQ